MSDPVEGVKPDEEGADRSPEAGGEPSPPEKTFAGGRFKTAEELEKSYLEQEKNLTPKLQVAAKIREQVEAAGGYISDEGQVVWPQQATQQQQPPPGQPQFDKEKWNQEFWENPFEQLGNVINTVLPTFVGNARQIQKAAETNVRREAKRFRDDPLYTEVADDFEQALGYVPDETMADPKVAQQTAEYLYNQIVGNHVRTKRAGPPTPTPGERSRQAAGGPAAPEGGAESGEPSTLTLAQKEMLAQMNIAPARQKIIAERVAKKNAETEEE